MLSAMAHTSNASIWEVEAGRSGDTVNFNHSLGYMRHDLKQTKHPVH